MQKTNAHGSKKKGSGGGGGSGSEETETGVEAVWKVDRGETAGKILHR